MIWTWIHVYQMDLDMDLDLDSDNIENSENIEHFMDMDLDLNSKLINCDSKVLFSSSVCFNITSFCHHGLILCQTVFPATAAAGKPSIISKNTLRGYLSEEYVTFEPQCLRPKVYHQI